MTALLGIAAVLLVGSSLLKLRAAERAKLGLHFPSILELLAGLGIGASMLGGGPNVDIAFRLALGAVTLVLVSSVSMVLKLSVRRREGDESEGARLFTYVNYLSQQTSRDEPPPLP